MSVRIKTCSRRRRRRRRGNVSFLSRFLRIATLRNVVFTDERTAFFSN